MTNTSRNPSVAPGAMVMLAVAAVGELTVVLLTVMPLPLKLTTEVPLAK